MTLCLVCNHFIGILLHHTHGYREQVDEQQHPPSEHQVEGTSGATSSDEKPQLPATLAIVAQSTQNE